jgi:outer membrane protein TolC
LRAIDGLSLEEESIRTPLAVDEAGTTIGHREEADNRLPPAPPKEVDLSLGEVRAAALTANLDLRVELLNPAIARENISQEVARFESTFAGTLERRRLDPPPGFILGGPSDSTFDNVGASITQPLTSGGRLDVVHDITKLDSHQGGRFNEVDTSLGVEFNQPLLRNAGYQVNTAGVQVARAEAGIADARSKLTAIEVLAAVERAYWRLYEAQQFESIARQQLELAEKQLQAARRLVQAGRFSTVEELRAEAGVLARRDAVISAQTAVMLIQRELKRIMQRPDLPVEFDTKIHLVTEPSPVGFLFDRQSLAQRANANRMEMLQLELLLLVNQIDIGVQDNSARPRLDFNARVLGLGDATAYRGSADSLFNGQFGDRLAGLTLEVPMSGNVAARARRRQAELRQVQTRIQQNRLSITIQQEVFNAVDRIEQNWLRVIASRRAAIAAEAAFRGEARLNELGQRTSTDVLIALTILADAQAQVVRAEVDHEIAKVDLALATGSMLGYGQVYWDPSRGALNPPLDPPLDPPPADRPPAPIDEAIPAPAPEPRDEVG